MFKVPDDLERANTRGETEGMQWCGCTPLLDNDAGTAGGEAGKKLPLPSLPCSTAAHSLPFHSAPSPLHHCLGCVWRIGLQTCFCFTPAWQCREPDSSRDNSGDGCEFSIHAQSMQVFPASPGADLVKGNPLAANAVPSQAQFLVQHKCTRAAVSLKFPSLPPGQLRTAAAVGRDWRMRRGDILLRMESGICRGPVEITGTLYWSMDLPKWLTVAWGP